MNKAKAGPDKSLSYLIELAPRVGQGACQFVALQVQVRQLQLEAFSLVDAKFEMPK